MLEHLRPVAKLAALRFQRTPSWTKKRPPLRLDKRGRPFRLHHRIDPANGEADAMVKAEGAPRHPAQNQEKSHSAGIRNPPLDTASLIAVKDRDRNSRHFTSSAGTISTAKAEIGRASCRERV